MTVGALSTKERIIFNVFLICAPSFPPLREYGSIDNVDVDLHISANILDVSFISLCCRGGWGVCVGAWGGGACDDIVSDPIEGGGQSLEGQSIRADHRSPALFFVSVS